MLSHNIKTSKLNSYLPQMQAQDNVSELGLELNEYQPLRSTIPCGKKIRVRDTHGMEMQTLACGKTVRSGTTELCNDCFVAFKGVSEQGSGYQLLMEEGAVAKQPSLLDKCKRFAKDHPYLTAATVAFPVICGLMAYGASEIQAAHATSDAFAGGEMPNGTTIAPANTAPATTAETTTTVEETTAFETTIATTKAATTKPTTTKTTTPAADTTQAATPAPTTTTTTVAPTTKTTTTTTQPTTSSTAAPKPATLKPAKVFIAVVHKARTPNCLIGTVADRVLGKAGQYNTVTYRNNCNRPVVIKNDQQQELCVIPPTTPEKPTMRCSKRGTKFYFVQGEKPSTPPPSAPPATVTSSKHRVGRILPSKNQIVVTTNDKLEAKPDCATRTSSVRSNGPMNIINNCDTPLVLAPAGHKLITCIVPPKVKEYCGRLTLQGRYKPADYYWGAHVKFTSTTGPLSARITGEKEVTVTLPNLGAEVKDASCVKETGTATTRQHAELGTMPYDLSVPVYKNTCGHSVVLSLSTQYSQRVTTTSHLILDKESLTFPLAGDFRLRSVQAPKIAQLPAN